MTDAISKLIGLDLTVAKRINSFSPDAIVAFMNGEKAVYTLERFIGRRSSPAHFVVSISRYADVMVPHSIDIPPSHIAAIVFQQGSRSAVFHSLAEASFYYHIRIVDALVYDFEMLIYLKPGVVCQHCNVVFRCYFICSDFRDLLQRKDNENAIEVPVGRNVFLKRGAYTEKRMAKL